MAFRRLLLAAALLCLTLPATAGAAGLAGWHPAASLPVPLQDATATTLANGDVLVAGGRSNDRSGDGTGAFLYDPAADKWSPTGRLDAGRYGHTATPLDGGKRVLVVGGLSPSGGYVATAEIYDLERATWSSAGDLRTPRAFHTATTLRDGRVLVAGGEALKPAYATDTQIYDPVKNGWTAGGVLAAGRDHAAAAFAGGSVVLAGGDAGDTAIGNAVLSTGGAWSNPIATLAPRTRATATPLSNGTVLLAGGTPTAGAGAAGLASTEIFDPARSAWTPAGPLRAGRLGQTATALPDGDVLVAGGSDEGSPVTGSERFHAGRFSTAGDMVQPRADHVAALLDDGSVLAAGGAVGDRTLTDAERWTPPTTLTVPGSLAFAGHAVGSATDLTLTVADTGSAPLLTGPAAITGPNAADFALVGDGCATTAPAGTCVITLRFTPHAGGPRAAALTFADNTAGGSETVALSGTGLPAVGFTLAPPGSALVGPSASVTASVTEGGAPVAGRTVTFTVAGPNARTATATTDANGRATLAYAGAAAGDDTITATYLDTGGVSHSAGPVTLTWRVAAITLTPVVAPALAPPDPCAGAGLPDHDGDRIPDACDTALPAGNRPVVAGSVARVALVSGEVFVKLPGSALADGAPAGFVPLKGVATIPMGSVVDARGGTLALTTAAAYRGSATQSVRLSAAIFALRQARTPAGPLKGIPRGPAYADLVLQTPAGAAQACALGHKGAVRALSGAGAGHFRTVGAASTATVAGNAAWSVADRCDGTLTAVGRGRVRVLDRHTHRTRTVRAGQAYLVRARLFAARQR